MIPVPRPLHDVINNAFVRLPQFTPHPVPDNDRSRSGTTCSVQPGMSLPQDLVNGMQCNPDATHDSIIQLHNKLTSQCSILVQYTSVQT